MTPDVNILVAASRQDHPHHAPALAWLEQAIAESAPDTQTSTPLVILPMVASSFLRLATMAISELPARQRTVAQFVGDGMGFSELPPRQRTE